MFSDSQLAKIFKRTQGHCHFCGDLLALESYAQVDGSPGAWEIDHVVQRGKSGTKDLSNCLPACVKCNRLRWHRSGHEVRNLLLCGLIAKDEIKKKSVIGKAMEALKEKRLKANLRRRRGLGK